MMNKGAIVQATLRETLAVEGVDIFSGRASRMLIHPESDDAGYSVFVRGRKIPATLDTAVHHARRCGSFIAIERDGRRACKVEHALSALYGAGIDNAVIEPGGEFCPRPGHGYRELFDGLSELRVEGNTPRRYLTLATGMPRASRHVRNPDGPDSILLEPSAGLVISYTAGYPSHGIADQSRTFRFSRERYGTEIAGARGPVFLDTPLKRIAARWLGRGITAQNSLIAGLPGQELSASEMGELVSHKILDEIGALALVGPLQDIGVSCRMTGHRFSLGAYRELRRRGAFVPYGPVHATAGEPGRYRAAGARSP